MLEAATPHVLNGVAKGTPNMLLYPAPSQVVRAIDAAPLLAAPSDPRNQGVYTADLPRTGIDQVGSANNRIIAGQVAQTNPGAVALLDDKDDEYCTATQIAPQWILTAWHCIYRVNPDDKTGPRIKRPPKGLRVGSLKFASGGKFIKWSDIIINDNADMAVVKLAEPSNDTPLVTLSDETNYKVDDMMTAYGWGRYQGGDTPSSPDLKMAQIKVYQVDGKDGHNGTAVVFKKGDGSPAPGDSGGPVFGQKGQVGVCSQSLMLGRLFSYSKITAQRDWIRRTTGV
ncbi:DNA-directed RNA polymerase II subunit RPB1-like [Platysternon megacephalum]|uniref:DNA-directed RNA polymerase II subunit RPB1-like n=1 Tax=Platysternon megacephalum TaxID=55544 RepID=A0A4D9DE61_9SAUR|nr:DNA-directed RNA polymerase II subunit RPB1-like [Platysternon megacephalum]